MYCQSHNIYRYHYGVTCMAWSSVVKPKHIHLGVVMHCLHQLLNIEKCLRPSRTTFNNVSVCIMYMWKHYYYMASNNNLCVYRTITCHNTHIEQHIITYMYKQCVRPHDHVVQVFAHTHCAFQHTKCLHALSLSAICWKVWWLYECRIANLGSHLTTWAHTCSL